MKLLERLKTSSKWQVGMAALIFAVGQPVWVKWGMNEAQLTNGFLALMAILGAQAAADWGKESK